MSLNAAALKIMAEKGLTALDIVEIAEAIEASAPQSTGAARQARYRERQRNKSDVTCNVTSDGNSDASPSPSPNAPLNGFPKPLPNNPPLSPNPDPPIPSGIGPQPVEIIEKPLTVDEIVEAWNERMVKQGFPAVKRLTATRQKQLKARLRENSLDDWQQAMSALERSPFLRGENDRGWRADFDFLLQPKSFTKLLEGAYDH